MSTLRQWLPRWDTPAKKAGRTIGLWTWAAAICLGCWTQSLWACFFFVCLVETAAAVYSYHLDIKLRLARRESEDV